MAQSVHVVLAAKSVASDADHWKVNVSVEGALVSSNVPLTNPINKEQEEELRWYLETYAQFSPYSSTNSAVEILGGYARAIWNQLNLESSIPREKNGCPVGTLSLEILDKSSEHQDTSTVHQLHWELLEDPHILGVDGPRILVKRSLREVEAAPKSLHRIKTWPQTDTNFSSINILLVVARDLTPNSATYNDISPWTAFRVLAGVKRSLASQGSPVQLNIEIVRPGTFKAFQTHLTESQNKNGPGYFHIVHFDLHGNVKQDNKGYLYFNSPNGDGTIEVPAVKVATTLRKFQVPCAVLNACESARANAGDDANIASILRSRGVKDVLAMSYKVSARAAEVFLQAFYESLLTQHASFAVAARIGRDTLRLLPGRGTRFRLKRDVIDWFVPVLYSSGEDSVIQWQNLENASSPPSRLQISGSLQTLDIDTNLESQLQGRDFDLLRLEKMLLQKRISFLHGPSGAGKSALLKYAREIWTDTAFLDVVVYINFRESTNVSTEAEIANLILKQLLDCKGVSKDQIVGQGLASDWEQVADILQKQPSALILDNMDAALTVLGSHEKEVATPHAYDVLSACAKLVEFASKDPENPCYLIFSDRRGRFKQPLSERTKHEFKTGDNIYKLDGLQLSDATELAHRILQRAQVKTSEWTNPDRAQLQLVLEGLHCLPGALEKILPLAKTSGVPWTSFYTTLICHTHKILRQVPAKETCAVWEVLDWARKILPSKVFRCLMLLGAYWYEAPGEDILKKLEIAKCVGGNDESMRSAIVLAIDGDLIAENGLQGFWVHPLFTTFTRTWAMWDRSMPLVVRSPVQSWAKIFLTKKSPDHWFIQALCEPDPSRIKSDPKEKKFLEKLMACLAVQFSASTLAGCVEGLDYRDMVMIFPTRLPNLLTVIEICRNAGKSLPLEDWPQEFLTMGTAHIRMTGRVPEMMLFAQQYEFLLNEILDRLAPKGPKAIPLEYLNLVLMIANYLASTYLSDVQLANDRSEEFAKLALDIGNESEPKDGFKDSHIIYLRGFAYRYNYLVAIRKVCKENTEESINSLRNYWGLSDDNDKKYLEALEREQRELQSASETAESDIPEVFKELRSKLVSQSVLRGFVEARQNFSGLKDAIILLLEKGESEVREQLELVFNDASQGLQVTHKALKCFGFSNLKKQTAWAPKNLNIAKVAQKYETEQSRLERLDSAIDAGDQLKAADEHRGFLLQALKKNDIDEAVEHVNAMEELYADDPQYSELLSDHRTQTGTLKAHRDLQTAFGALSDGSGESAAAVLKQNEAVIAAMRAQGNPQLESAIRGMEIGGELWKQALDRDASGLAARSKDLGARVKTANGEFMRYMMENVLDPTQMQRMIIEVGVVGVEIQTLFQQQYKAHEDGNLDEELRLIDRQLELTETDVGKFFREFCNPEKLRRDRTNVELIRNWRKLVYDENFLGARMELKLASQRDSAEILKVLWKATEELQLISEMMHADREVKSAPPSVSRYDKLLGMYQSGEFSHMDQADLDSRVKIMRHNRSWARAGESLQANDWGSAVKYSDECLAIAGDDVRKNPRKYDDVIDMKEAVELSQHIDAIKKMDFDCDYAEMQPHVDALRKLFEQRQSSPEVRRTLPGLPLTRQMLDTMQSQLTLKKTIIQMMGLEQGKTFILASRQAPGSQWPH